MSGSSQGWDGGPLRLWNARSQRSCPAARATSAAASRSCGSYAQPAAMPAGMLCAVNTRRASGPSVASAARTWSALAATKRGWL